MEVINALLNTSWWCSSCPRCSGRDLAPRSGRWATFRNVKLVLLVVVANLVLVPLIGWGTAAVAVPGHPGLYRVGSAGLLAGRPVCREAGHDPARRCGHRGVAAGPVGRHRQPDVRTDRQCDHHGGEARRRDLASRGTAGPDGGRLAVAAVCRGAGPRKWAAETAARWRGPALQISNLTLVAVLALSLLGSWQQITALVASLTLLAALIFNVVAFGVGTLVASGSRVTRTTAGLLAPARNAGPVFAAVGIAFNNDPEILGAITGILLVGLGVGLVVAGYLAKGRPAPETAAEPQAESPVPAGRLAHRLLAILIVPRPPRVSL